MNVLIVEDNPISSKVLEHTLDRHGYETVTAHDGDQALECLESRPDIELVITDIMMPKTDGVELVRKIRERPEWTDIPVLVCTSVKPAFVSKMIPAQGWKYIFKPIRADSLIPKVKEAFAQRKPALQNPDQTMSQIGMDSEAFFEVVDEFSKVVKEKIGLLEKHIKEESEETIDLQDLSEGATLLRAERVTDILNRLNQTSAAKNPEVTR